jgi:YHS domain-containing protein
MLSLLRLLITLVIAITVIRSVVHFFQRLWAGTQQPQRAMPPRPPAHASAPVTTMLQQDPVCGTYVAVDSSLKKIVGGRVIHFCSAECRDRYPG